MTSQSNELARIAASLERIEQLLTYRHEYPTFNQLAEAPYATIKATGHTGEVMGVDVYHTSLQICTHIDVAGEMHGTWHSQAELALPLPPHSTC